VRDHTLDAVTADWKAEVYHRVSEPQRLWGEKVLSSLVLRGDETVMDAGCGTGRLTALLLARLPRGRVIGVDASAAMLEVARRELGDRVTFVRADLGRDPLPENVDVVFSTATFHWVHDHDALFRNLARALVPGGRLHAQCGGAGNLDRSHALTMEVTRRPEYASYFVAMPSPWNFADVATTRARLSAAGFTDLDVSLEDAPTPFATRETYAEFVGAVVLRPFLACLPPAIHERFIADVTTAAEPSLLLDYVRLNLRAARTTPPRSTTL